MSTTFGVHEPVPTPAQRDDPPLTFDVDRALEQVRAVSQPRLVGSVRERRTARYLRGQFHAFHLSCRPERFRVPQRAREAFIGLTFGLCAALVVGGVWLFSTGSTLAASALWLTTALLVNAPWRVATRFGSHWPGEITTENLIASLAQSAGHAMPARVVFMAHYDSKSQRLPTGIRVALVFGVSGLCLLLALGAFLMSLPGGGTGLVASFVRWVPMLLLPMLAALALNRTGNHSPGALDNGTGLGVLLELARTWRPTPEAPTEVFWIATAAEEIGLDGARDFLRRHDDWLRDKPTLLINLDSVGAGATIYLAGEPGTLAWAEHTAADLGLATARLRILGAAMDHQPFANEGLCALTILGDVVGQSMAMHSRRDTMAIIDRNALHRAAALAARLAWHWAERYQPPRLVITTQLSENEPATASHSKFV